ncbi:MAG: HAMP domain-containing histidine kinase, partial [Rhodospirillales bacterium]|nr:HAMP domain-containing histidine kinase [Rhodospirillales bacterium]
GVEIVRLKFHERMFLQRLEQEVAAKTVDLREANEVLAAANRTKDTFLAMMSHELRTPLNGINGFAQLAKTLLMNGKLESIGEYLDLIHISGMRLENAISGILDLSALASEGGKPSLKPCSFDALRTRLSDRMGEQAERKQITLQMPEVPDIEEFSADSTMLGRALECIIDNAIKFSQSGSTVVLDIERTDSDIRISTRDHGCGMTDAQIESTKSPFASQDSLISRHAEGCGIGLSLARMMTEAQGGRLEIDSAPGKGTTVTLVMPKGKAGGAET